MPTKIILDTDIDIVGDIDDALCLTYLLAQPACDLLGITTVAGDTDKRAMVASAVCKAARSSVPIFPGAQRPLLVPPPRLAQDQRWDHELAALAHWDHDRVFPRGEAVTWMRQTIHDYPHEIVLVGVGPMTNLALLFAVDPDIAELLKGLVLMCGMFTNAVARQGPINPREWNALYDPHATAIVYNAAARCHRSVGLDVTEQVKLTGTAFRERLRHAPGQPLHDFAELWLQQHDSITFHDPLAAATIFDEHICSFARGTVDVELGSAKVQGLTYWTPDTSNGRHEAALAVDTSRFLEHFFTVVGLPE